MSPILRSISLASLLVTLGLGIESLTIAPSAQGKVSSSTAAADAPTATPSASDRTSAPTFRGQDRFDDPRTVAELRELECEVVEVVERVRPSVVLLRIDVGRGGMSSGTAVIIGKDGLLATCGHVGRTPGRDVTAVLADGTELRGRTLGQFLDGDIDCGLVQLDVGERELPAAELGTTSGLSPGDWLIALGYTHGLTDTNRPALVRVGRVLNVRETSLFFDAPIDAGDSGGPSFNLKGEVVGLNARCGRESWKNLATPIDRLRERIDVLREQREPDEEGADGPPVSPPPSRHASRFPSESGDEDKLAVERAVPLKSVVAEAEAAMIRVYSERVPVAFGVVIDGSGLAVTKASQLKPDGHFTVETSTHKIYAAREVARDETTDVALLSFDFERARAGSLGPLKTIRWDADAPVLPGAVLLSPRGFDVGPALGFAAIERRESEPDAMDGPFLGVQTRRATRVECERAEVDRAVTVVRVVAGAAAAGAGLTPGDIVTSFNGTELDSPEELRRLIRGLEVGDQIRLETVGRDGAAAREITLGRRGDARDTRRGNTATPISQRSSGFGSLLAHDTVTEPEEMGSPLVDLDGRVVGMNIARYDRTATHAIGADRMVETCRRLVERFQQSVASPAVPPRPQPASPPVE
ncbi:MAG: trypsin-like peptidase domain-containing protein [Phycisphaerae bacterium]|nr:trypsin-like peptidase domain-containing protein [Phycisphaerae bacterium]